VKTTEAIMEILAAYDLTQSYRDAAVLVGCALIGGWLRFDSMSLRTHMANPRGISADRHSDFSFPAGTQD
jgi:hypothetical protein